jgi:NADPH-dependent 2,4-dienoyl-CoA reductase/sulfur reductase-like enzyme
MGRIVLGLPLGCTMNPATGREGEWGMGKITTAARKRKVLVAGGGPGGMEAARMAALRGHEVSLYEQDNELGGQVRLARTLPGRADIGRFIPWHRRQLEQLGVKVTLGVAVTPELVKREAPDVVVVATGASWEKSGFNGITFQETPGWEQPNVLSLTDAVGGDAAVGDKVVIFDLKGFVEAPGLAEQLAGQGKQVEIVTPFPRLGSLELDGTLQWPYVMPRLLAAGVTITPDTTIEAIDGRAVTLANVHTGARRTAEVDTVVIISGRAPQTALYDALAASGAEVRRVGDCLSPHNIGKAIREGWTLGLDL